MRSSGIPLPAIGLLALIMTGGLARPVAAQTTPHADDIPQSIRLEHENALRELTMLSHHRGPVGVEAGKALVLFKRHLQREAEFILPPLTLLLGLADGKVSPDMKWAVAMADRVKAERENSYKEHTQITDAMNALAAAARKDRDLPALEFAQAAVADSLNDTELLEPMSIVIGDYLRLKLPAGQ